LANTSYDRNTASQRSTTPVLVVKDCLGAKPMRLCPGCIRTNLAYVILLVCALPPLEDTLAANPDVLAEIAGRYESNVSNSDRPSDRLSDGFLLAAGSLGRSGVWGRDWRWQAGLASEGKLAFRFFELSEIEAGVRLGLERKFGLGWKAPRLQLDFFPAFRAAGQPGALGFSLVPALTFVWQMMERAGISINYVPHWFFAQGALFDSAAQETGLSGWFDLFPSTRLFAGYSFRYGDVVSYATPPRPDLVAIAEVREATDVFGAERMAYRFDASTHSVQAGVDQTLTRHMRLRAMYRFEITTRGSLEYANHIAEIGVRAKF
jgi:hypothetical protein